MTMKFGALGTKKFNQLLANLGVAPSLGDVKTSMLTEAQFQELHGNTWVLMDGRDVTGSTYESITGQNTVPDARGQFLRRKNNDRADDNEDPDGERSLGDFQVDEMQGHKHKKDSNWRSWNMYVGTGGTTLYNQLSGFAGPGNVVGVPISDGVNGTPRAGLETRPKNIAINYFIKINS